MLFIRTLRVENGTMKNFCLNPTITQNDYRTYKPNLPMIEEFSAIISGLITQGSNPGKWIRIPRLVRFTYNQAYGE